jgi:hypothetical protein
MKKKNWILTGLVVVIAASCFLIIGSASYALPQKDQSTCCSQKMKNCAAKSDSPASGEMFMENLSRQFLSITSLGY